jgi:hypothetical protein
MLTAHGTCIPTAITTPSTSTITEATNELRTSAAAGRRRRYGRRAAHHRPGSLGSDHADCTATGLVEIRNGDGRASGRDRARPLDTVGTGTVIAMTFPISAGMTRARTPAPSTARSCSASPRKKAFSNYRSSRRASRLASACPA